MKQRADLTFKLNMPLGRHGWLRLTPAYSVTLVQGILASLEGEQRVLEPFAGTGTTGVTGAQAGHRCDLFDINPFLVWLCNVKACNYTAQEAKEVAVRGAEISRFLRARRHATGELWIPSLKNIERWWTAPRLTALARLYDQISLRESNVSTRVIDLLKVAFCRVMIESSNAAFNHQSMSFKDEPAQALDLDHGPEVFTAFADVTRQIAADAAERLAGTAKCVHADSRILDAAPDDNYTCLITSPPYPNRMSYVRELRPYMYWLGYLSDGKQAGELDWQAIGGTWGAATSRVAQWQPQGLFEREHPLIGIVSKIAVSSPILANYVHKYFEDMVEHFKSVRKKMARGGRLFYIIGNSKFYGTVLPAEEIYGDLLVRAGFQNVRIDRIRKRNSKKELFEFVVSATVGANTKPIMIPFASQRAHATALLPFEAAG